MIATTKVSKFSNATEILKHSIVISKYVCFLIMFKYFLDGCTTANGRFYQGGQTWALPNCKIGICAKSFNGGWEVSVEG